MQAKIIVGICALAGAVAWTAAIVVLSGLTLLRPAPEVRFTPLSGETFSTSELRGKVVLVNFWATYCARCVQEMPKIVDTHRKFAPRGYETVAVAVRQDNPAARRAVHRRAAPCPSRSRSTARASWRREFGNVRLTPTSFLIDKQGRVLRRYVGEPNWTEVHQLVDRALAS